MDRLYSLAEIAKHNKVSDLWVVIENNVYDVTKFVVDHPGGEYVLLDYAGRDATSQFNRVGHSADARSQMKGLKVGTVFSPACLTFELASSKNFVTIEEVAKHNKRTDLWIVLHEKVYDVTNFIRAHPGGIDVLIDSAGKDATTDFEVAGHSDQARKQLVQFVIGPLLSASMRPTSF